MGTGSGTITYEVDPNAGGSRNATLFAGGHGFDLLQEASPSSPEAAPLSLNGDPVSVVNRGPVFRPYGPFIWESHPDANVPALGGCFGNCGAGCSDRVNPCGGRTQWWEMEVLSEPQPIAGSVWQDVRCINGVDYLYEFERYQAWGRWTYHGHAATGCEEHDAICPEFAGIGCLWFNGCGPSWDKDWSYEDTITASRAINIVELSGGVCQ